MKQFFKSRFNAVMTLILSLLGFGTFSCGMYGVPHGSYDISGKVVDDDEQPLGDIQVVVLPTKDDWHGYPDTTYTSADGTFYRHQWVDGFGSKYCIVTAKDTTGRHEDAAAVTEYEYMADNKPFSFGTGYAKVQIKMKKI